MSDGSIRVLLVEDDGNYSFILKERFKQADSARFEVLEADHLSGALQFVSEGSIDAVLLDLMLPDSEGLRTFAALHEAAPHLPIVVLTGLDDERTAMAAVQAGAQDYLIKGKVDGNLLVRSIRYAIERSRLQGLVRALAIIDDLTGLLNRRGFLTVAEQQLKLAGRTKRTMLLFFLDVDGLKRVNDTFGHQEGDRVLIEVADLLRETCRESDIIGRLGGDEFTVLALEASEAGSAALLQRLDENLARRNRENARPYPVSVSVGTALYDVRLPRSIDELVAEADARMYERKKAKGRSPRADEGPPDRR